VTESYILNIETFNYEMDSLINQQTHTDPLIYFRD